MKIIFVLRIPFGLEQGTLSKTKMKINQIDTDQQVFIVAEIGNNHEGDFDVAHELIRQAAKAGADAVKFQTFLPEY